MSEIVNEKIEKYIEAHSQTEPKLLQELNKETWKKVHSPGMLSGHYQGRLLSMISKLTQPKNILEIGTYTGYSALCMAEGMQSDGKLHTIDVNEELYDLQRKYFDRSDYGEVIIQHVGDAKEIIPTIDASFDLVFIDADKRGYRNYVELVLPKMNSGGLIISDNVLWKGKVVEESAGKADKRTESLQAFNVFMNTHPQLETILLPIRDGLTLSRVK